MIRQRDAKGHFLPTPGGPTAKVRTLEEKVANLEGTRSSLYERVEGLLAEVKALTEERDNWMNDSNRCAESLRDAEATIERQAGIISRHALEKLSEPVTEQAGSPLPAIIICSIVGAGVGFLGCKYFPGVTQTALVLGGGAVAALAVVAVAVGSFLRSIDHTDAEDKGL